ncbi:MgtC/SapB family protein [Sulfuricurvum sp.]|uniref:MgtC/SapB family protein n=1 Tax=Sulfuricurvum sp. TaxID=2025608 RepID=UPI0026100480|nr:MgtC/SapB family protein [Sulfuricurvum sp.]MDD2266193.1 MgtC/SapB family protein [Sulfuricurvum sp.]MDD2783127.1 MgtC/SapB family protein [Sulfuricurvum sp.]
MDELFVQNSVLALILGFIIGLEREMHTIYAQKKRDFGGSRTFSMIALLGFLSSWFSSFIPHFFLVVTAIIGLFLISTYIVNSIDNTDKGSTTEFSALVTFLIGAMLTFSTPMLSVFMAIIVLFVLNLKDKIQEYEKTIAKHELNAAVMFMMMTFVILPILPDRAIDPLGLVNFYRIWIMVVLVAGISFFGYIMIRFFGATHGIGAAGLFGGLISSTAVAMNMARRLNENGFFAKNFAIGITLASSMMLIRAGVEIWVINPPLARAFLIPILLGSLSGYGYIGYLYVTTKREKISQDLKFNNPFDLKEALMMGLIFGATLAVIGIVNRYMGDIGVLAASFVSGFADVDAIILSLSTLSKTTLNPLTAQYAIIIAIVSNTLTKMALVLILGKMVLFRLVFLYYLIAIGTFTVAAYFTLG